MMLRRICLGILAVLLAGCTKEYKTKPTLVVSEALGQRIQAAMIEFGGKNPEFADIKIIIVSGVIKQDEIDQLLKSGAQDFVKKPFDVADIIDKICAVLQVEPRRAGVK